MSTIPSSSSGTGSTSGTGTETPAQAVAAAQAAAKAALQQAAQSILSGVTGSDLDVQSLVQALVASKVAGQTGALSAQTASDNAQISAIGQLGASLSALQVSLAPLFNGNLQSALTATASGDGITATTDNTAVPGTYTVDVSQIAQSQSITSQAFTTDAAQSLGSGTLTLSLGNGSSMKLDVQSPNDSLQDIATAIENASNNPGISAKVISGTDGAHLVLSAKNTGANNAIGVTVSDAAAGSGLASLAVSSDTADDGSTEVASGSWKQSTAGQDAVYSIDGIGGTSASNSITGAITGVTINLTSAAVSGGSSGTGSGTDTDNTQTLTIAADTDTQVKDIEAFVTAYNAVVSTMGTLSSFDQNGTAGSQGGPLLGDSMLQQIQTTLGNIVGSGLSGPGGTVTLATLGITLNSDGSLDLNDDTLQSAVQANPAALDALFNTTKGVGAQLNDAINTFTQKGGIIDMRNSALSADLQSVTTQTNALTAYEQQLTTQYTNEFNALNTLMATTTSNSQYLTQLFGGSNSQGALSAAKS